LNVSAEFVAFFLGSALSEVKTFKRLLGVTISFKNFFLTIFFFSFGMLLSIKFALPTRIFFVELLVLLMLSIGGKFAGGALIGKRLHGSFETGLKIGAYTMPRGEFSIVLLAVALGTGMSISELLISLVISYVIILAILGAFFAKHGDRISKALIRGIHNVMPPPQS